MISPAMFEEFFLPYMARVSSRFGHVYYGCCEPVHDRLELIKAAMPNLRSVSVSAWSDLDKVAGMLGAIAGAFMFLTIWKNRDLSGKGLDATFSAASILTLFAGVHSTDTARPWLYILLIAATPLISWLVYKIPLKSPTVRAVLAILAACGMVAATLGIAFVNRPVDEYETSAAIR